MTSIARKAGILVVLCALAVPAVAVTGAQAKGLTAAVCLKRANGLFPTSECKTPFSLGDYETFPMAETTGIEGHAITSKLETGSTGNPAAIFHMTVAGMEITVTCGTGDLTGKVTNETVGEEMKIHGTEYVTTFTECHASPKSSPTKICSVQGTSPETSVGQFKTNKLTTITGPEHVATFTPESGEAFTEFKIIGAESPCFTKTTISVKVTGKLKGEVNAETHNHLTFNEGSGEETKANGTKLTYTSTVSTWMEGEPGEIVGGMTF